MNAWAKQPAPVEPAKSCSKPQVFERKGVVVSKRSLFWLTRAERSVIISQVNKYRRCVASVIMDREKNHMKILWKGSRDDRT